MRVTPRSLIDQVKELEKIIGVPLWQGFEALFMATNQNVEEILARLIDSLPDEHYVEAGFIISEYLQVPREYILKNKVKTMNYLRTHSELDHFSMPRTSTDLSIPGFAKRIRDMVVGLE